MDKNKRLRTVLTVVMVGVGVIGAFRLGSVRPVEASCQCDFIGTPDDAFEAATIVFKGEVTYISDDIGFLNKFLSNFGIYRWPYFERNVTFEVTTSWKGLESTQVTVWTLRSGENCGYQFSLGTEYLVYGFDYVNDGRYHTNSCVRTEIAASARAADDFTLLATKSTLPLTPSGDSTLVWLVIIIGIFSTVVAGRLIYTRWQTS